MAEFSYLTWSLPPTRQTVQLSKVPPWRDRAVVVDYREVLARKARFMPVTPENIAALVAGERLACVMNWISEGTYRRAVYATRVAFRVKPDRTLEQVYAI